MDDTIIEIRDLKKKYRLGSIGGRTLTGDIQSWWAKKIGKEDPNLKIGQDSSNEEFWALKGIDLDIQRGDALGIIGINGAGKSTMLKILSRVTAPTEGTIRIKGKITSMLEVGTGFHGELTGRQNVYLNGAILGMSREEIDSKLEDIIEFSECGEFIDTPVKRYSSGMYVKLAFAVASHLDSDIMIMDEVLAVGDAAFQKKCLDKMRNLAQGENRTILYVSHNMNTIRTLCNKCIVLEKGTLVYQGNVDGAIKKYLNADVDKHQSFFDLSEYKREINDYNGKAKIMSLEIVGQNDNYLEIGQKMILEMIVDFIETIDNFAVRCSIHTMDAITIGATMSSILHGGKVGEKRVYQFEFDASQIAPGQYGFNFVLFQPNGFGNDEKYEVVEDAMTIEIISTKNQFYNMSWSNGAWGYCAFPQLKLIEG